MAIVFFNYKTDVDGLVMNLCYVLLKITRNDKVDGRKQEGGVSFIDGEWRGFFCY